MSINSDNTTRLFAALSKIMEKEGDVLAKIAVLKALLAVAEFEYATMLYEASLLKKDGLH